MLSCFLCLYVKVSRNLFLLFYSDRISRAFPVVSYYALTSLYESISQSVNDILCDILINFNERESVCDINRTD